MTGTMAPTIFIDGEAGTTGLGIRERLRDLPVTVLSIDPDRRKDHEARLALMRAADLVVLCLPDAASVEASAMAASIEEAEQPRLLDASSAHRVSPDWVYGFPELAAAQPALIAEAARVSNPGCYATGAIALLAPLVASGIIPPATPLTINAISGYSGGGKSMIADHEADGGPAFHLYALGLEHKHIPEIVARSGLTTRPIFVPSVGHFAQGMIVSIPLHLAALPGRPTPQILHETLAAHYAGSAHVSVLPGRPEERLTGEEMAGSDRLELRVHGNARLGQVVLTARLDNLGKGASGAAIQNIRLMLSL